MRQLDSYIMTSIQHDTQGVDSVNSEPRSSSVLGGGSDKIGDPHAEQFGGVESPLSRPQELGTLDLRISTIVHLDTPLMSAGSHFAWSH